MISQLSNMRQHNKLYLNCICICKTMKFNAYNFFIQIYKTKTINCNLLQMIEVNQKA